MVKAMVESLTKRSDWLTASQSQYEPSVSSVSEYVYLSKSVSNK